MLGFYLKGLVLAVLAGALAGIVSAAASGKLQVAWVIAAVLVVFVLALIRGVVRRLQTTYTITNERLTIDIGLLGREVHETRLERVQNVTCRQTLLERILAVGTVDFDTAASGEYDFSFYGVAHPRRIVRTVDRALGQLQLAHPRL